METKEKDLTLNSYIENNVLTANVGKVIVVIGALFIGKRKITEPLLFHSNRGTQYVSREFRT